MSEPAYFAWYPSLEQGRNVVSIILSPGTHHRAPTGDRDFYTSLLTDMGVGGELVAWAPRPFLSSYFARAGWQEAWDAKILLNDATVISGHTRRAVPILREPVGEEAEKEWLPILVFADFTRLTAARACRAHLKQRSNAGDWGDTLFGAYRIRDIGEGRHQLLVDVATRPRTDVTDTVAVADDVNRVCQEFGGDTHAPWPPPHR